MQIKLKQTWLKILFWFCTLTVLFLSCLPGSAENNKLFAIQHLDKLTHCVTFFVLSILLLFAYKSKNLFLWTAVLMALFGFLIELLHLYIPNRTFSFADFAADVGGIALAFIVYKLVSRRVNLT